MVVYVSLGSTCSIAYNLRELNLRDNAYPFDWIRILNLNNVSNLLENNFDGFLDVNNYNFIKYSEDFMINDNYGTYIYDNGYCKFYHEFDKPLEECDIDSFIDKYKRRINRLYDLLNSDEEIIFIREELRSVNINKINNFIETIRNINENINFKLIIISNDDVDYNIDNVIFYYSNEKFDTWMRKEIDWYKIFNL